MNNTKIAANHAGIKDCFGQRGFLKLFKLLIRLSHTLQGFDEIIYIYVKSVNTGYFRIINMSL